MQKLLQVGRLFLFIKNILDRVFFLQDRNKYVEIVKTF